MQLSSGTNAVSGPARRLYNLVTLMMRRTHPILLAILVTAFVSLYPYLGTMEMCHSDECPYAVQSSTQSPISSAGITGLCLGAVLAVSSAGVLAFGSRYGRRIISDDARPGDIFLSLDPPPPQLSLGV